MRLAALLLAFGLPAFAADDDRLVVVVPAKSLPRFSSVSLYRSEDVKPGKPLPKPLKTITFEKGFTDECKVQLDGEAIHVLAKPKDGIAVTLAERVALKPGETLQLKMGSLLGVVEVFQKDGFPKVDRIVLTASDDPGPDEKAHLPVQIGSDYRVEMPVPEGFYAVWLVPANGARATRIEDRIRVLPGKIVRIGNE
jgi:hypothetical protein